MLTGECAKLFSGYFDFWDKLTDAQSELLCSQTSQVSYRRGTNIQGGDGKCTGGIMIKKGCLRVYLLSEDGREITLYRLYDGDMCMLSASCVLKTLTFDVYIDAEEDTDAYLISSAAFMQVSEENVWVENYALNVAVSRFSDVMWVMQQILFMSMDRRMAIFLNDELAKTGGDKVRMTQEQIARYMGSAREVVSRVLKYFSESGIVRAERGEITVLDRAKLRSLLR